MHNGFLQVEGEKMSKSTGNFITIRDLLNDWPGEVVRLNMLKTHYRSPMDWTLAGLKETQAIVDRWRRVVSDHDVESNYVDREFCAALYDDLNTPKAVARLHELYAMIKGPASGFSQIELQRKLKASCNLIGLIQTPFDSWHKSLVARQTAFELTWDETLKPFIEGKIAARTAARARKDFKESDRLRDELAALGVTIKDSKDGTTWEIAR